MSDTYYLIKGTGKWAYEKCVIKEGTNYQMIWRDKKSAEGTRAEFPCEVTPKVFSDWTTEPTSHEYTTTTSKKEAEEFIFLECL